MVTVKSSAVLVVGLGDWDIDATFSRGVMSIEGRVAGGKLQDRADRRARTQAEAEERTKRHAPRPALGGRAAPARHAPAGHHHGRAQGINRNPGRVDGTRIFAHRPDGQSPGGVKQQPVKQGDGTVHGIYQEILLKKNRPDHRYF